MGRRNVSCEHPFGEILKSPTLHPGISIRHFFPNLSRFKVLILVVNSWILEWESPVASDERERRERRKSFICVYE